MKFKAFSHHIFQKEVWNVSDTLLKSILSLPCIWREMRLFTCYVLRKPCALS